MPTYDYRCPKCGVTYLNVMRRISERNLPLPCVDCDELTERYYPSGDGTSSHGVVDDSINDGAGIWLENYSRHPEIIAPSLLRTGTATYLHSSRMHPRDLETPSNAFFVKLAVESQKLTCVVDQRWDQERRT